jgi:hypothetical protein
MQDIKYLDAKLGQLSDIADKALSDLDDQINQLSRNITALAPGAAQVHICSTSIVFAFHCHVNLKALSQNLSGLSDNVWFEALGSVQLVIHAGADQVSQY